MRKNLVISSIMVACFGIIFFACSKGQDDPSKGKTITESPPIVVTEIRADMTKDLIQCPASGEGYKYVDVMTLATNVPTPTAVEATAPVSAEPKTVAYDDLTFKIFGNKLTVSDGTAKEDMECTFDTDIISFAVGDGLSTPIIALATAKGLKSANLDALLISAGNIDCGAFKSFSAAGGIKEIFLARSVDHTRSLKETTAQGLLLSSSKSLNAPVPGTTVSKEIIADDYIYFLNSANWFGRIKPQGVEGGCVEFIWSPDQAVDTVDVGVGSNANNILITLSKVKVQVDLIGREFKTLPIE